MGDIVAAFGTAHAPQLMTRPPDERPEMLDASIAAMRQLGEILDETKPDVVIVFGSDHLETFSMTCVPTFAVIAGNRARAEFAGRSFDLPVPREMAEDLLVKLVRADFDVAYSEDAVLGHAFATPFEYVLGGRDIPVIPVFTNVYLPPLPSARRAAAFGREVARIVRGRPENVAIIASGGMSHYPGTWKYPTPEYDFDRWLIAQFEMGNIAALLDMTPEQLDEVGNTEMLTWAAMFGAIGERAGELVQYTPTWHHGHGFMRFLPVRERRAPSREALEQYGGFQFKNQGFEFYTHPPASAYNLNRLLFEVRHDAALRQRIVADVDAVAVEYGLDPAQRLAARALVDVGGARVVSDFAKPLVEAGAHPLQALMSLHVIYASTHRAGTTETSGTRQHAR